MPDWTWEEIARHEELTEGPVWDGSLLLYNECAANTTYRYDPATGEETVWRKNTGGANGQNFSADGRLFNCEGAAKRMTEVRDGEIVAVIAGEHEGVAFNAPNDVAIDTKGDVWFTDPNYGERPTDMDNESVYRATETPAGWEITRVTFDTTRPNGLLFSLDEQALYVAESPGGSSQSRQLRAYPINDDGSLSDAEILHDFGAGRGIDGMCLSSDGNIVATAGSSSAGPGSMIYVFDPNGNVISTHPTPVEMPTNCAFAEADLSVLYVTFGTGYLYRVPNTGMRGHIIYPQSP